MAKVKVYKLVVDKHEDGKIEILITQNHAWGIGSTLSEAIKDFNAAFAEKIDKEIIKALRN